MRWIAALGVVLMAGPAWAQDAEVVRADVSRRTLHGHTFMLPASVDSAFIQSTFTTRTSVRYEIVNDIPIGSRTFDLTSIGVREQFDLELALGDIWEVGLTAFGQFLAGTDGRTLATQGALYAYGGSLKGAVRIARIESSGTQIAARAQLLGVEGGERFSLLPLVFAVRANPLTSVPDIITNFGDSLVTSVSWLDFGASVDVAQTITRALSIQGMFRLDIQRLKRSPFVPGVGRVDTSTTSWIPSGALAVGLNPVDFPVAFMGEYRLTAQNNDDLTSLIPRHAVALGVYYSARPNLQLGPVFFGEFHLPDVQGIDLAGNPSSSNGGSAFAGQLMMTYYW